MTDVRKCSGIFAAHQAEAIQKKDLNVILSIQSIVMIPKFTKRLNSILKGYLVYKSDFFE